MRGATLPWDRPLRIDLISTHAPLAGRDRSLSLTTLHLLSFQPTRPLRGATFDITADKVVSKHFNPRAPCGARRGQHHSGAGRLRISTHAPLAGRDKSRKRKFFSSSTFQPTRPLRGATHYDGNFQLGQSISTHAPLAGRGFVPLFWSPSTANFNPRAPCGARRNSNRIKSTGLLDFNPRAPCGARRRSCRPKRIRPSHFNPRAPCGARLLAFWFFA